MRFKFEVVYNVSWFHARHPNPQFLWPNVSNWKMRGLFLIISVFLPISSCLAQILNCTLNKIELVDRNSNVTTAPILGGNKKPETQTLILAGLDSNRITAMAPILSLAVETQLFQLTKDNGTGLDGREWYYIRNNIGLTLIELDAKRAAVKVHALGDVPYTFIGSCK